MVFIPPSTFMMGSPTNEVDRSDNPDDDDPQIAVIISRGFWMGKYEVTQREYLAVMGSNPSYFQGNIRGLISTGQWKLLVGTLQQITVANSRCKNGSRADSDQQRLPTSYRSRMGICVSGLDFNAVQLWG
jgi:formylglycine-generating enzyme required for sulfatase activity